MTERHSLPPLKEIADLDGRWLAYVERTRAVFAKHPLLVPLRQTIFKDFVENKKRADFYERMKHWARYALRHTTSSGELAPTQVVFWLDSLREVMVEPLLAVLKEVQAGGVRTALVLPDYLKADTLPLVGTQMIRFCAPFRTFTPKVWQRAWADLRAALPAELNDASYSAYVHEAAVAANFTREMERLLTQLRPELLVTTIDQLLPASAIVMAARNQHIPSLLLQHGAVIPYNAPLTADHMAVWGSTSLDQMVTYGVPAEQMTILGSPRHDRFPVLSRVEARTQLRAMLDLSDKAYFVFFSNGNDPLRNSMEALEGCAQWLDAASRELSGQYEFLVRLHPNESGDLYRPYPQLKVFKNESPLDTTLGAADICAALCSTTLSDALLYNKPVLQFYAEGWRDLADNWRRGLAERIANRQQLVTLLRSDSWQALARQQALQRSTVFAEHGQAAASISAYIRRQLSR